MDEIYIIQNNTKQLINDYLRCSLEPNLGVIISTIGYINLVGEKLFQLLIEQNKWFKEKILSDKYIMFIFLKFGSNSCKIIRLKLPKILSMNFWVIPLLTL